MRARHIRRRIDEVLPHQKQLSNDAKYVQVHAECEQETSQSATMTSIWRDAGKNSLPQPEHLFERWRTRTQRQHRYSSALTRCLDHSLAKPHLPTSLM